MPTARNGLATAVEGDKIYAIGGVSPGFGIVNDVTEYDPTLDVWTPKAAMPTARWYLCAATAGGKVYAIGGAPGVTNVVEEYNPVANTWASVAPMPTPRMGAAAVELGGFIYVMGGWNGVFLSTVERYDSVLNTWTPRASMPTARGYLAASVINGKIYAVGGGISTAMFNVVEEYDAGLDTWTSRTPMPTSRNGLASASSGYRLYVVGGTTVTGTVAQLDIYDANANSWLSGPSLSAARFGLASSAVLGKIYAFGGNDDVGTYYATTEELQECVAQPFLGSTCLPSLSVLAASGLCYNAAMTPNPDILTTTLAVTGFNWNATITRPVASAPAGFTVLIRPNRVPLPNGITPPAPLTGRVLIAGPLLASISGTHNGTTGSVTVPLPCDVALLGRRWAAQATIFGGGAKLSSAVEGTVGSL
jgi:N-acetylneuraminic acid mutarotase